MKWMLLVLLFKVGEGHMEAIDERYQIYASKSACNAAGEQLQRDIQYPDPEMRSISVCVPESAFNDAPVDAPEKPVEPPPR